LSDDGDKSPSVNITEDEIKIKNLVKRGNYSFIQYNDNFFQFIFNKIIDKNLLNAIIRNIADPVIQQFFKAVRYLSKAYYPVRHEHIVIKVMEKEFDLLLKIQAKNKVSSDRIALVLFPYLYELSYFNHNKAPLLKKYAQFIVGLGLTCQRYIRPDVYKRRKRKRIRIGFISFMINQLSSVFRDRSNIIKSLNKELFDVTVCSVPFKYRSEKEESILKQFNSKIENYIYLNVTDIEQLKSLDFDIVVYPDIGMTGNSILVAYNRLAPVQINTWGHSVTSGIPTIDYYMSSKYFELEDLKEAATHYSEQLIAMDSLCTCYPKFEYTNYESRESLQLPTIEDDIKILFCLQNPRKINEVFMNTLYKIYQAKPNIIILLLKGIQSEDDLISNYLKNKSLDTGFVNAIRMINYTSLTIYNTYLYHSDIVLDPYPFGGCNSSLEAFSKGKIVITRPAKYLSGRFTLGFYKKMGVTSGPIVNSEEEYIEKTLYYLQDTKEKKELSKFIQDKSEILYNEKESIVEWQNTLLELVKPYVELEK
jgi:predicted O-linked N-acetylglucosamine transferase (SPINDLY family)